MNPSRYMQIPGQPVRKSKLEGKPSMLPKPRRPGSTDRLSTEICRPSSTGPRSRSADAPRVTFGTRLSREASVTKVPMNARSRSQMGEPRYLQSTTTPVRSSHYTRETTTPKRTPSADRANRTWEACLDRALAFVTIKDQRPLSSVAWQRAESSRVSEALSELVGPGTTLIRPLTIARFVDITGALLTGIYKEVKLNTDNYVTKLPHLCKRLLYPGNVSKSWLRTVNTLHAFPHALALIGYLLDLLNHIKSEVLDEQLYVAKDEVACLRRDYLRRCWIRFQEPSHNFDDLSEEYLHKLKVLLGYDENKIVELLEIIKKYETELDDETEQAARADEARRVERRDALLAQLRAERAARLAVCSKIEEEKALKAKLIDELRQTDLEVERAVAESNRLREEVAQQPLSVTERTKLLDEVDYAFRVHDSKQALAEQVAKMVHSKETELALWQKKTLDSCMEYKQGLIQLAAEFPELSAYAIDENELMSPACADKAAACVTALRARAADLEREHATRTSLIVAAKRQRQRQLEEVQSRIEQLTTLIEHEQQAIDIEVDKEKAEAAAWALEELEIDRRIEEIRAAEEQNAKIESELEFWEKQDATWRSKLSAMREYIDKQKEETEKALRIAEEQRANVVRAHIRRWNEKLQQ